MKVLLNYDESTGELSQPNGVTIINWMGLEQFEQKEIEGTAISTAFSSKPSVSELKDLKEAGFEAFEIAEMRKAGLV